MPNLHRARTVAEENKIANYRETISVLQELYKAEIIASKTYSEFALKAEEEKYYSVSRLFSALGGSETVHARNFKNILNDLGVEAENFPDPDIKISNTKTNLKWALKVELSEIDKLSKYNQKDQNRGEQKGIRRYYICLEI
jgi:rubrerythrin